ncbi:phage tail sheath family protein [Tenacibaculum sp. Ill]|uniref:phage tail sheath family protein n=1 Tax=Tenacibaculum sp. Ill TaxID=3445935 RepID=UPI003F7A7092
MSAYKTPGVYVEEIVKFPPSVAQVETAIPAFIGYTEKAEKKNGDTLALVPTRITSLLEYETYFGKALKEDSIDVEIVDKLINKTIERSYVVSKPSNAKPFLMYYAMQMYFANGGGPCYIVSVDQYGIEVNPATLVSKTDLDKGLAKIRKEDEPTLLLFPDAVNMGNTDDFFALYNDALAQCNELQDRFAIIDTETDDEQNETPVEDLRSKISNDKDYVKYGAAYYPFLETILDYDYDESSVSITHISELANSTNEAVNIANRSLTNINNVIINVPSLITDLNTSTTAVINAGSASAAKSASSDVVDKLNDILSVLNNVKNESTLALLAARNSQKAIDNQASAEVTNVKDDADSLEAKIGEITALISEVNDIKNDATNPSTQEIAKAASNSALSTLDGGGTSVLETKIQNVADAIDNPELLTSLTSAIGGDTDNGNLHGLTLKDIELIDNAAYNTVKSEINAMPMVLPPSSAMAGVYARVDSDRGVWKAPANVSLNYVIKPTLQISHEEQQNLNVDTVAGKSINAIRSFVGKGNLVWGARTLAGNDNEWRYVSVRRFFNMAEESIKKASEQFVFEPNDKNTWVRVKAMIDNFLTQQWRAGALAGPTPEKAFYVSVGLGETMTAQDVLEGNMIIEIGMAVVRPAEFIILKFSHKMQEA